MKVLPNKAFQPTREKTRAAEGRDVSHPMPDLADNKPSAWQRIRRNFSWRTAATSFSSSRLTQYPGNSALSFSS